MTDDARPDPNPEQHTYRCHHCGSENTAAYKDIGKSVACIDCGAELVVPRPRVRLAMRNKARRASVTSDAQAERPPTRPSAPPMSTADTPKKQSDAVPAPQQSRSAQTETDGIRAGSGSVVAGPAGGAAAIPATSAPASTSKLGAGHVFGFALGSAIGLVSYFLIFFNPFSLESALTDEQLQAQIELILQRWRSAERSRTAIDEDLAITLAEMEINDMAEEAALVKRAIVKHEDNIVGDYQLSLDALMTLRNSYETAPSETEASLESVRSRLTSERAGAYLETLELITQILYANHDNGEALEQAYQDLWAAHVDGQSAPP